MRNAVAAIVLVASILGVAGCGSSYSVPSRPSSLGATPSPPPISLNVFVDPRSGFATSDIRDADEEVVQFNTAGELIWPDGTRLRGYWARGNSIPAEAACGCWLAVRFGTIGGERRAYFTADYGHDNPGTLVDLQVTGGVLVVKRTSVFAPGTYTLSGVITEATANGPMAVEDAGVWRINEEHTGWQVARTDKSGYYELRGLYAGGGEVSVIKAGYETARSDVTIDGDTRFDRQLVRQDHDW
jgi:hypothetical protein